MNKWTQVKVNSVARWQKFLKTKAFRGSAFVTENINSLKSGYSGFWD